MRWRWLGYWLVLQLALPLQAATVPAGAPGTPPPAEREPVRAVLPVAQEPSPRGSNPTGAPGTPPAAERVPARVVLPAEPAPTNSAPLSRSGETKGSLLDQSLTPKQWRGIKQPTADAQLRLREWLVFSRNLAEAQAQRQALQPFGLNILRRQKLGELGRVISVFRIPDNLDLQQLEMRLRQQFPDWQQELNLRYLPSSEPDESEAQLRSWGQRVIGQAPSGSAPCGVGVVLAMLDGPVNPELAEFAGAALIYQELVGEPFAPRSPAAARHGNGIAALLVGQQQVPGLLPAASLYALGVFGEDAEVGLHTRTDWLLSGLDHLLALPAKVQVVNLSFGGGYSRLLESSFQRLQSHMQFVAAAGNDGMDGLRYPAAYPGIVAVGAVDARLRRLRQSNYGVGLSLVAPGEDIWTLDERGEGYFAGGTSLAAPFVSAALALPGSLEQLRKQARDIGPPGSDAEYAAGLVQMPRCY